MIAEVPAETPDKIPVELVIVATTVLPLVHTPPVVLLVSVAVLPKQSREVPEMAPGSGLIVTTVCTLSPKVE